MVAERDLTFWKSCLFCSMEKTLKIQEMGGVSRYDRGLMMARRIERYLHEYILLLEVSLWNFWRRRLRMLKELEKLECAKAA